MKKLLILLVCSVSFFPFFLRADHSLSQIEKHCEVYRYSHNYGELECSRRVGDRRNLQRKCEVYFSGSSGEFECRGSHYRDVERKCEANLYTHDYADIDC